MLQFRPLTANEIDCRVSTCNEKGVSLLLYKDARCDQNILDETVGPMNWQRHHSRENANCIVSIWDAEKKQWVEKEDTGTESYTEKEKGLASDSFKRACFNWGIGRELYTAPFIWVPAGSVTLKDKTVNGKTTKTTYDRFTVTDIKYENGVITGLKIRNDTMKKIAYAFGNTSGQVEDQKKTEEVGQKTISTEKISSLGDYAKRVGVPMEKILETYGLHSIGEMTEMQFSECVRRLQKTEKANAGKVA